MVTFDLTALSLPDLGEAIASHCAQFGTVANVKIVPRAKHRHFAIAIVTMSNEAESEKVASTFGDMKFGTNAVIQLQQEERQIPAFLKRIPDPDVNLSA